MPPTDPHPDVGAEVVRVTFANSQRVDVLRRLSELGAQLRAGHITDVEHAAKMAELRASFLGAR